MSNLDPVAALDSLDATWAANFDDYAAGRISVAEIQCVLCDHAPCQCVRPCRTCGATSLPRGRSGNCGPCDISAAHAAGAAEAAAREQR